MRVLLLAVVSFVLAGQANALSCRQASLGDAMNGFAQSEKTYLPVLGTYKAVEPVKNPNEGRSRSRNGIPYTVEAELTGRALQRFGKGKTEVLPVTVEIQCIASWCGSFPPVDKPILTFLEKRETGYVLEVSACPGGYFPDISEAKERILRGCLRAGKCSKGRIQKLSVP